MTNEEAIKLIDDMGAEPFDNYGLDDVSMALYMAKKALEERPTGEWIPVSERLPEESGLYLISVDDVVTVANFTGTYFLHRSGCSVKAYAWMPLPAPYKEGEE